MALTSLGTGVLADRLTTVPWTVLFASFMFLTMLFFYARNMVGGGDIKLLTVAFLWTGVECALPFAILLTLFSGIHAWAASYGAVASLAREGGRRVAFAPAITAALVVIFLVGCLSPQH